MNVRDWNVIQKNSPDETTGGCEKTILQMLIVTGGHDFDRESSFEMFGSFEKITYKEVGQPTAK